MNRRELLQMSAGALLSAQICLLAVFSISRPAIAAEPKSPGAIEIPAQRDAKMRWWREARFGMFIHWGLYALPAGEWKGKTVPDNGEWILKNGQIPVSDYKALAGEFNPAQFDADSWVATAKNAGMKYIVITAKHHDGFAMFDSKANDFNAVAATPFKRDPLREMALACKKQGIRLGFYYSQDQDWTAPGGGMYDKRWDKAQEGRFDEYLRLKSLPQFKELLSNYGSAPDIIWFDTPTEKMTPQLAQPFVDLLKKHPKIIWNNRLGAGFKGYFQTPEQTVPANGFPGEDWETCMTMNNTWGFRKDDNDWKSSQTLVRNLVDAASRGGNYLLNVGPTAQGVIPAPSVQRLAEIGQWMNINGDSIYDTKAGPFSKQLPWGRATQKKGRLYLHVFDWPADGKLTLPMLANVTKAYLLADKSQKLRFVSGANGVEVQLPRTAPDAIDSVVVLNVRGEIREQIPAPNPKP